MRESMATQTLGGAGWSKRWGGGESASPPIGHPEGVAQGSQAKSVSMVAVVSFES